MNVRYNNINNVAIQPIGIIRAFYIFYILKVIILECYYKNKRGPRQWRGPVLLRSSFLGDDDAPLA